VIVNVTFRSNETRPCFLSALIQLSSTVIVNVAFRGNETLPCYLSASIQLSRTVIVNVTFRSNETLPCSRPALILLFSYLDNEEFGIIFKPDEIEVQFEIEPRVEAG
jgi:hypothetical protein